MSSSSSASQSSESDSEADTTEFFTRPPDISSSKRNSTPSRPKQHRVSRDDGSSSDVLVLSAGDEGEDDELDDLSRKDEPRKRRSDHRRESRTTKPTIAAATRRKKKPSTTSIRLSSSSSGSESDLEDPSRLHGMSMISSTQLERNGDALRNLARERGGWQGSTPPGRSEARKRQQEEVLARQNEAHTPDAESEGGNSRKSRRTSNSTAATSLASEPALPNSKPRSKAVPRSKASTSAAAGPSKRKPTNRSPSPERQPSPPVSFWGADSRTVSGAGSRGGKTATKAKIGEKSAKLRTLSEQRSKILDLGDDEGADEDDIIGSSSSGSDQTRGKYETVAQKAKRERLEGIAKLKASRNRNGTTAGAGSAQFAPFRPVTNTSSASRDKGKGRAASVQTTECPVCNATVPTDEFDSHLSECAPQVDDGVDDLGFTQAPAPAPASLRIGTGFRPGLNPIPSTSPQHAAAKSGRHQGNDLANELFPSQEAIGDDLMDEDDIPIPIPARLKNAKGKGKAVSAMLVQDSDDEHEYRRIDRLQLDAGAGGHDEHGDNDDEDLEGYYDDDDDDEDWGLYDDGHDGPPPATLHKTVIHIDDDDDDDDLIIEETAARAGRGGISGEGIQTGRGSGGRGAIGAGAAPGTTGKVNSKRVPGPPQDGSPPPKGSLYLSTMSRVWREGYESMYARASGHKNVDAAEAAERDFDPMRPQKMTTATAGGGRGGRGGRRGRGGFRSRGRGRKRN
ncbi:uncharacterized protein JCM15063_004390 [Sporobolomyces koalae]|uniref:uncharacterized protein n=1 Tax=Sporobolomyces koalae TaxID=500713 RepID=UPI0031790D8C